MHECLDIDTKVHLKICMQHELNHFWGKRFYVLMILESTCECVLWNSDRYLCVFLSNAFSWGTA